MSGSTSTPLRANQPMRLVTSRCEQRERVGALLRIDGLREVDEHQRVVPQQHVVRREVAVHHANVCHHVELIDGRLAQRRESLAGNARVRQTRRHLVVVADVLEHHLGADALHRIRHGDADRPQPAERLELGPCPQVARNSMPRSVPFATARSMRRSPVLRPPRYRASSRNVRSAGLRYRLAASSWRRSPSSRSTRNTSASLPVLSRPSSYWRAASSSDHPFRNRIGAVLGLEVRIRERIVGTVVAVRASTPHRARGRVVAVFVDPSTSARSPRAR